MTARTARDRTDVMPFPAVDGSLDRRRLAKALRVERQWVDDRAGPGSRALDRFERAIVFAMREASRMKVDGT